MKQKTAKKTQKQNIPRPTLKQRLSSWLFPMLLSSSVCFAVYYALDRPSAVPYTLMFTAAQVLLFMLFDWLKTKGFLGSLLYTGLLIGAVSLAMNLMFSGAMEMGFMTPVNWFYGEEGVESHQLIYLNALLVGGGFFIISVMYYFTQIRYRSLGVMLCIMFPFFIYAKRADIMPDMLTTVIVTLFLAVMIHNRQLDPSADKKTLGRLQIDRSYIISIAIFISLTGALTMAVDKPTYRSQLERNSDFFDIYGDDDLGSGSYQDLSDTSSSRGGGVTYSGQVLFYMTADSDQEIFYLRDQAFTYFNGLDWITAEPDEYEDAYAPTYTSEDPEYSTDDLTADMAALGHTPQAPLWSRHSAHVYGEEFRSNYLPAVYGVITDTAPLDQLHFVKDKLFTSVYINMSTSSIPALDQTYDYIQQDYDLYTYAQDLGLTGTDYILELHNNDTDPEAAQRLLDDYRRAVMYYTDKSNISDRLTELAEQITADCHSDLEKAIALQDWFEEQGFEYSLEYEPPDLSIDYFVFESKTGYCVSYATAMTLMARSIGLPARYVEGFAAYELAEDQQTFVIRDGHAHAFVEVYIPGAGWLTFDPTVPDYRDQQTVQDQTDRSTAVFTFISRFFLVILVGAAVVFVLLLDRIRELFFRLSLTGKSPREKTVALYRNLKHLAEHSSKRDLSAYTVKLLAQYLRQSRGIAPEKLLALYGPAAFGGYEPTPEEFSEAYKEYKSCYKLMRRLPRDRELRKMNAPQT